MTKASVFTMKLEPELRDDFMAETASEDRPASQVMRELMRRYIDERQQARDYAAFLRTKVDGARRSVRAGRGISQADIEAEATAWQRKVAPAHPETDA